MSPTIESLRRPATWIDSRTIAQALTRGIATAVLLTFMTPSSGAASDRVLRAVLSDDAETVEASLRELWDTLYGPLDGRPWSIDSVGAFFQEDVDLESWFGEVLERIWPEALPSLAFDGTTAREIVSEVLVVLISFYPSPEMIEFAAENHRSPKEILEGWPGYIVDAVPTMEGLRAAGRGGLLGELSENVTDDEARRLALVFASQMRRVQAALPRFVEDEYQRRQRSGTIGSDGVLDLLLSALAYLHETVGTEETRAAAWTAWIKERESRGLPADVVGVKAPWNLFSMTIAHSDLRDSGFPLAGRALAPGVRRVALALIAEPALADRLAEGEARGLEAAVALLANERPLAKETGKRILDLYCGPLNGGCFEKLNLLYAGPDDPSLRLMEAEVGRHVVDALTGMVDEVERQCGALAKVEAEASSAADARTSVAFSLSPEQQTRERIVSIGEELQDVLGLVGRMDSVPEPVLDGVFEFWSTERFPEARRILEDNDWLEPDVAAAPSEQREGSGPGLSSRRFIAPAELCRGK